MKTAGEPRMKPNRLAATITLILLVAVLVLGGWLGVALITRAVRTVLAMKSESAAAIVAASAVAFASVISIVVGKYLETRALIFRELRAKKIPVYEDLIAKFFSVTGLGSETGAKSEEDLARWFAEFSPRLLIWGSDQMLLAYARLMSTARKGEATRIAESYGDLLLAIRRDLGHKNRHLAREALLATFIKEFRDRV